MLTRAEARTDEVDARSAEEGARASGLLEAAEPVAATLYPGLRSIIEDAVMQRSERCSSGLELRRRAGRG